MLEKMIMAGFGGQGLLFMGKLVAQIMMEQGRHVTYFPSYGAEVRGGTANCHVIISDDEIHSPVAEHASTLIIMNAPSYGKYAPRLDPDGLMLLNTSVVHEHNEPCPGKVIGIAATDEANALGSVKVGNMVLLGAYLEARKLFPIELVIKHLSRTLAAKKPEMFEVNVKALERGREIMRERI